MTPLERIQLARVRLIRALAKHTVASRGTLEQKISDAGPFDQRIDPHLLTKALSQLAQEGTIQRLEKNQMMWYHLSLTPPEVVNVRLAPQVQLHQLIQETSFTKRVGQSSEIAVFRALKARQPFPFLGAFPDLDLHDDGQLFTKEEPPFTFSGNSIPGKKRFDFALISPEAGWAGIEVKNVRQWLYPNRDEIKELLLKSCAANAIPVLIARRIPFVTFKLLHACGGIIHQTYNQLFPTADTALASRARDKNLLAYHDIRVGNEPDARLLKFIGDNLPQVLTEARWRLDEYKDILEQYATGTMPYAEFAARVRRRTQGRSEDNDWE